MTTTDSRLLDKKVAERAQLYNNVYEEGGKIFGTYFQPAEHDVLMIGSKEIPRYSEEQDKLINHISQMEWYQEFVDDLARDEKPIEALSAQETCEALLTFLDRREGR
jgi:hypothetical protein